MIPHLPQLFHGMLRPVLCLQDRPRHLEYGSHADSCCPTVQRVTAASRQQYCIDSQRCRRTENCAYICGIYNIFQNSNASGISAQVFHLRQCSSAHGTEHSSRQFKAGNLRQHFIGCHIYGNFPRHLCNPPQDFPALLRIRFPLFHQK